MLKLNVLTIKNFMSIGNVTQTVNFTDGDIILVLGENLDLGGNDNRNGVGKSTILNALSYVLFGSALTSIKKDNLINKSNLKNMYVTLSFEINGVDYRIERGRKPGIFKFIKDGVEAEDADSDESQGESRHTQMEVEKVIGISHEIFKHILALNTYVEPFLALKANDQRIIIEQLLGITKLSEKSEKLKEEAKVTRDEIKEEEFRISASVEANKRIEQNILGLRTKESTWEMEKIARISKLQKSILELLDIDVNKEIELHKSKKEVEDLTAEYKALTKDLASLDKYIVDLTKSANKFTKLLTSSTEKICPTCAQSMDKDTHEKVHEEYLSQYNEIKIDLESKIIKRDETKALADSVVSLIPKLPNTFYSNIHDAYNHKTTLDTLGNSLSAEIDSINPYTDQIISLSEHGLQEIDFTVMNELVSLREHQDFLLKMLTSKDSFIRKKIIDQNLSFLNHRLAHYLTDIGLPHSIKFKSDLEVEISMYGKEFDFDNLSRGERTRLILSLSWAFRDVYESMNDKINLLFVDELLDQGLDSAGVDSSLAILKTMARDNKRNIFLISHRDELTGRVSNVLKVIKENGFTSIELNEA